MKQTQTLNSIAATYGVATKTFRKWLSDYPNILAMINSNKGRLLPPKTVNEIYQTLGKPKGKLGSIQSKKSPLPKSQGDFLELIKTDAFKEELLKLFEKRKDVSSEIILAHRHENEAKSLQKKTSEKRDMVGFRCTEEVKNKLLAEASKKGKTLAGFLENLVNVNLVSEIDEFVPVVEPVEITQVRLFPDLEQIEQVEIPKSNTVKLAIGVKVMPQMKLNLIKKANEAGVTLSSYCETILSNSFN